MANAKGVTVEGEHMVFPYLSETFYLVGVEHDDVRPNETAILEGLKKLTINFVEGIEVKGEDVRAMVRPLSPGVAPMD